MKILPATRVRVRADRPLPLQADGELLGPADEVRVELLEEKVQLWIPREN